MQEGTMSVRKIVIAGVLSAIAMLLGWTRLGFIPVPTAAGNATIMHVPAIVGGVLEGGVVGGIVGALFGLFSFLEATVPMFKDPLVAVLPRILIGITAWLAYAGFKRLNEYLALVIAAVVGTLTNTIGVLAIAVMRGYMAPGVAWTVGLTHGIPEVVVAAILTVAIVVAWKRIGTERAVARM